LQRAIEALESLYLHFERECSLLDIEHSAQLLALRLDQFQRRVGREFYITCLSNEYASCLVKKPK
jgi:hypothetical protein